MTPILYGILVVAVSILPMWVAFHSLKLQRDNAQQQARDWEARYIHTLNMLVMRSPEIKPAQTYDYNEDDEADLINNS